MSSVFIVGVGRSGTSLLQSMLNAHSGITSIPEAQFFRKYLGSKKLRRRIEKYGTEKFKKVLNSDVTFQRLSIDPATLKSLGQKSFSVLNVYEEIIEISKARKQKSILVDKDPRNLELIKDIFMLIQGAKIIHIIRDPRDVVNSKTKAKWSANRPYWLHAMIGEAQLKRGSRTAEAMDDKTYFSLLYEDLLKSPEKVLKQVCSFIGVPYEENMLRFNESAKELVTESEMQWKKETLQPLNSSNVDKWKANFSFFQVTLIESLSPWTMRNFTYKSHGNPKNLGFIDRIRLLVFQFGAKVFSLLYSKFK